MMLSLEKVYNVRKGGTLVNKKQIAIILGIVCFLLTIGICIQAKTIKNANKVVGQTFTNNDLRDQVLRWKERYDTAYKDLQEAEKTLENVRQTATADKDEEKDKEKELKNNNMLIGLTNVIGEGVIVTLKDDPSVTVDTISITDDISRHIVHDADIKSIVNELKNAGAEAISINGQRIVATTSITCEGNVININGEKVSSPFVIKAIGQSLRMYSALMRGGGYVQVLNAAGTPTTVKQAENIKIPKFTGIISSKYLKYVE